MYITQVTRLRPKPGIEDVWPKSTWDSVVAHWLPHLKFQTGLPAVIEPTRQEALDHLAKNLRTLISFRWAGWSHIKPEHFEFEVSEQGVRNNEFWMPSHSVWCKWHPVGC